MPLCPGLDGSRATLADDSTITAARAYNADQVIYSIGNDALLSPVAAYADKDVGPPLRDIAQGRAGLRRRRSGGPPRRGEDPRLPVAAWPGRRGRSCWHCCPEPLGPVRAPPLGRAGVRGSGSTISGPSSRVVAAYIRNDGAASVDSARSRGGESRRSSLKMGLAGDVRGRRLAVVEPRGSSRTSRAALSASPSRRSGRRSPATLLANHGQAVRSFNFRAEAGVSAEPTALVPPRRERRRCKRAVPGVHGARASGDVAPALVCARDARHLHAGTPSSRRSLVLSLAFGFCILRFSEASWPV